jgi:hypothetical protein
VLSVKVAQVDISSLFVKPGSFTMTTPEAGLAGGHTLLLRNELQSKRSVQVNDNGKYAKLIDYRSRR